MKSTVKIYKDDLSDFYNFLKENGAEVNTEICDWRVMMWRRDGKRQWTQAYDGKTRSGKNERDFIRAFGDDEDLVNLFYNKGNNQ